MRRFAIKDVTVFRAFVWIFNNWFALQDDLLKRDIKQKVTELGSRK